MNSNTVKITLQVDDKGTVKIKGAGDALDQMGTKGKAAGKSLEGVNTQTAKGRDEFGRFTTAGGNANKSLGEMTKGANLLGVAMKGALAYFSVSALVSFETAIINTGKKFESTMATVKGVSRATDDEFQALKASAREMGETTEWSASQSAEALKYMSMAGFTANQSIAALPGVLDLATAGNLELGRASDIVTDSLTAMGLGVDGLSHFSDVLIATTTRSNTNIEMMGESMKFAAPIAHSLGYDVEELSALIGTLANAGIKASDAGTDLRQAMLRNSKAAQELGTDNKDLIGTIKAARDANWDANKVQKEWGIIASKSVLVLMENIEKYEELYGKLQNVEGATGKLAGTMRDTTEGAWKEFKSVVESVELDIFAGQSDSLKEALRGLSGVIRDNKGNLVDGVTALANGLVSTGKAASTLIGYYNALPSEVTTGVNAGIVARLLTGSTPIGVAAASLFALNSAMEAVNRTTNDFFDLPTVSDIESASGKYTQAVGNIWDVLSGKRDWSTGALLAPSDDDITDASARVQDLRDKYLGTWSDYDAKLALMLKQQQARENEAEAERLANERAAAQVSEKIREESRATFEKGLQRKGEILTTWEKKQLASLEKVETKESGKWYSSNDIYKKGLQRRGELLTDWEQDQIDLQDDLVDEFEEMTGDQYEFERQTILKKAKMYEDAGADKVDVAEWVEGEIERINDEEAQDTADLFRKNAIAGDDFFDGLKAGYADNLEYARTWGHTGYDIMRDFAQESGDVVGDLLFDAVKGDMDSLGDYWESFWDGMLQSMTSYIGQMVAEWATTELLSMGASFASAIFHDGSTGLKEDEMLATVLKDEIVIPVKQSNAIRDAIGTGGKSADGFFNDVAGAVQTGTVMGQDYSSGVFSDPNMAGALTGAVSSAALAGSMSAFSNYGQTMTMGAALQNAGYDISTADIQDVAMDQAISGAISSAVEGFAGSFMGSMGNYALGTTDMTIGSLDIGALVNAAIGTLAGVSMPGMMYAALSPLTNLAISAMADVMGLRSNETMRDHLEDAYGELAGRRAYNAAVDSLGEFGATVSELGTLSATDFGLEPGAIIGSQLFGSDMSYDVASGQVTDAYGNVAVGDYGTMIGADFGSSSLIGDLDSFNASLPSFSDMPTSEEAKDFMASLDAIGTSELAAQIAAEKLAAYNSWQGSAYAISHHGEAPGTGPTTINGITGPGNIDGSGGISPGTSDGASSDAADSGSGGYGGSDNGEGNSSGYGRWTGGPVSPGYMYEINERGQEMYMPGADGRILNAQETQTMLATLKQIASTSGSAGSSDVGAALYAIAKYCQKSMKILDKWDHVGMPEVRA